jgi:hypothetical protein
MITIGIKLKHTFSDIAGRVPEEMLEKIRNREVETFELEGPYLIAWQQVMDEETKRPVTMPYLQHINAFADDPTNTDPVTFSINDILYPYTSESLEHFYREILTGVKAPSKKLITPQ